LPSTKGRKQTRVATLLRGDAPEEKVMAMLQILKFAPAVAVPRPAAGLGPARRVLRAALLQAAEGAVRLAARLEAEAPVVRERAAARPVVPAGAVGVRFVEAAVGLAVAAYFVAGLVGVFAA
jgi:hypothetical protein